MTTIAPRYVYEDYQCSTCGATPELLDIIFSRGAYWHAPCASVFSHDDGVLYVDFPSDGRMGPVSIITETDNE